jgi:HSP20 family protein
MALQRYEPLHDAVSLGTMIDRLFDESVLRPFGKFPAEGTLAVDITETNDAYTIMASMPGVKPEDVQVTVNNNTVTIKAEAKAEAEKQGQRYLIRERRAGTYLRTLALPTAIDADKAEAKFEGGVLTLILPKSESAKSTQISVRTTEPKRQQEANK